MTAVAVMQDKLDWVLLANVITNAAVAIVSNLVSGLGGVVPKYLGWGTGAHTSVRADTALTTETYSTTNNGSGNQRVTTTVTRQTTTLTNDTVQFVGTLTCPSALAPLSIVNAGLYDTLGTSANLTTAPSGGNLFLESDFGTVTLNNGDTLQLTFSYVLS